jgi:hypothetical protein
VREEEQNPPVAGCLEEDQQQQEHHKGRFLLRMRCNCSVFSTTRKTGLFPLLLLLLVQLLLPLPVRKRISLKPQLDRQILATN